MKWISESISYRTVGSRHRIEGAKRCLQLQLPRYEIVVFQLQYLNTEWRAHPSILTDSCFVRERGKAYAGSKIRTDRKVPDCGTVTGGAAPRHCLARGPTVPKAYQIVANIPVSPLTDRS